MRLLPLLVLLATPALADPPPPAKPAHTVWGKANEANLRAMARPEDLALPAPIGPASGALEAAAVARLLAGKPKDLLRENAGPPAGGAPR